MTLGFTRPDAILFSRVCACCRVLQAVTHQMKHLAHEHSAQVAALHLDRETAVKVAHDEFRRVEEQLKCVPVSPCVRGPQL